MRTILILGCLTATAAVWGGGLRAADPVTLVRDGRAVLPIVAGSVEAPVRELQSDLKRISGAELDVVEARRGARGAYVGLAGDFPWVALDGADDLGAEGFIVRSQNGNLYLLAGGPPGVQHAVTTFLRLLAAASSSPARCGRSCRRKRRSRGPGTSDKAPTTARSGGCGTASGRTVPAGATWTNGTAATAWAGPSR